VVSLLCSAAIADTVLVRDGKSDFTVVLSESASPSEAHAAQELRAFVRQVSGADLPQVIAGAKLPAHAIFIGDTEALRGQKARPNLSALGDEGFVIRTFGPHLVIAGGRLRGTMYGVYTFLEEQLGCRWYTSFVSRIPRTPTIVLKPLNASRRPDFEYRCVQFPDTWDADWAARNKINGPSSAADKARGGKIEYGRFAHTFAELVPEGAYFKDHPEYFSLIDGKRVGGAQLCLSNPDVVRIATATVMRWIKENPTAKIWSVSQNDNESYCHCPKCAAIAAEEGSQAGPVIRFVNAIADEVAKVRPDVLIDTLAYNYTQEPPKLTKPRPNVRVRLCVFDCVYHPYETCPANAPFMNRLRGWGKIMDGVYIWQYTTVFTDYLLPLPEIAKLSADIPMYKRTGVTGVFSLGSHTSGNGPAGSGGFMDGLKAYMLAKLLWDCHADSAAIVRDYLDGYFGKAGKPIGEYLYLLEQRVKPLTIHGWCATRSIDDVAPLMTPQIMARSEELFDQAERVADNRDVLARVKHARFSLEYVKIMRRVKSAGESGTLEERAATLAALKDFATRCSADGIAQWKEGEPLNATVDRLAAGLAKKG
jgi:hypothetical protein